jgi:hypothetical protein
VTVDRASGGGVALRMAESLAHLKFRNMTLITMPSATDTCDCPR